MAYCGPKGIPLSTFLAWPDDDQDAALVWQGREGRRCPSCGTHPDDWNPEQGGSLQAYDAQVLICPGCQKLDAAREREKDHRMHGAQLVLRPTPPPEQPQ